MNNEVRISNSSGNNIADAYECTESNENIIQDWGFQLIGNQFNNSNSNGNNISSPWVITSYDNSIEFCTDNECGSEKYTLEGYYYARMKSNKFKNTNMSISQQFTVEPIENLDSVYILRFNLAPSFQFSSVKSYFRVYINNFLISLISTKIYSQQKTIDITPHVNYAPYNFTVTFQVIYVNDNSTRYDQYNDHPIYNSNSNNNVIDQYISFYQSEQEPFSILLSNIDISREPINSNLLLNSDAYIDIVNGSDRTGNGTKESPFSTLTMALKWIRPSHRIYMADGVYCGKAMRGIISLGNSHSLSIIGQSRSGTIIYGQSILHPFDIDGTNSEFNLSNLTIVHAYSSQYVNGGSVLLLNSNNNIATLTNLLVANNTDHSSRGSISLIDNCELSIISSQITNNSVKSESQAYNNPSISILGIKDNQMSARLSIFSSSFKYEVLNIEVASQIDIDSSTFTSPSDNDILADCLISTTKANVFIRNSSFKDISAIYIFCLTESNVSIVDSEMIDNQYINLNVVISNLKITNTYIRYLPYIDSTVMSVSEHSTVHITNTTVLPAEIYSSTNISLIMLYNSNLFVNQSSIRVINGNTIFNTIEGEMIIVNSIFRDSFGIYFHVSGTITNIVNSLFLNNVYTQPISTFSTVSSDIGNKMVNISGCVFDSLKGNMFVSNSYFMIVDSVIKHTTQFMVVDELSTIILHNSNFYNNSGQIIYLYRSNIKLTNCKFISNNGDFYGATISGEDDIKITAENCDFIHTHNNYEGGVIYAGNDAKLGFQNCTFIGNRCDSRGGVISVGSGSDIIFVDSSFINNSAHEGGIVFFIDQNIPRFNNCTFHNNTAQFGPIIASLPNKLILTDGQFPSIIVAGETKFNGTIFIGDFLNQTIPYNDLNQNIYLQVSGNTIATADIINGKAVFSEVSLYGDVNSTTAVSFISNTYLYPLTLPTNSTILPCKPGYYPTLSSTFCTLCMLGSYGYDGSQCIPCPANSACPGGTAVSTRRGYWYDVSEYPRVVYSCNKNSHCLANNTCADHTFGVLCSSCNETENYYSWMGSCIKCNRTEPLAVIAIIVGMVFIVLWSHNSSSTSGIMNIVIYYTQTIVVLAQGVNFSILVLFNLQLESGGSSVIGNICPGPFGYYQRYYMILAVGPILALILLIYSILLFGYKKLRKNSSSYNYQLSEFLPHQMGALVKIFLTIYSPVSTAVFSLFFCSQIGVGSQVLVTNAAVQCEGGQYNTAVKVSYAFLACVLGLPLVILILLIANRKKQSDNSVITTYGVFFLKYRPTYYYWDVVMLFRRLLIVLVSIMDVQNPIRSILLVMVSLIAVILQLYCNPYKRDEDNQLEFVSLSLLFIACLYLGNEVESVVEDWVVIGCCVIFAIFFVYVLFRHYRLEILAKARYYIYIITRGRYGRKQSNQNDQEYIVDDIDLGTPLLVHSEIDENDES